MHTSKGFFCIGGKWGYVMFEGRIENIIQISWGRGEDLVCSWLCLSRSLRCLCSKASEIGISLRKKYFLL